MKINWSAFLIPDEENILVYFPLIFYKNLACIHTFLPKLE